MLLPSAPSGCRRDSTQNIRRNIGMALNGTMRLALQLLAGKSYSSSWVNSSCILAPHFSRPSPDTCCYYLALIAYWRSGGWRSGSAAPLHGDGRGFESLIAHHPSLSASLRVTDGRPALRSEHSGERRLPRRSKTKTGYDAQLLINAPNYGSASHPHTTKSENCRA